MAAPPADSANAPAANPQNADPNQPAATNPADPAANNSPAPAPVADPNAPANPAPPAANPETPNLVPNADPNQPAAPVGPKTLAEFATLAMQMGREQEALQLIYAEAALANVTGGKRASEMRWVAPLKRPTLALRWGLGVLFDGSRAIPHPNPIPNKDGTNPAAAFANNQQPPPQPAAPQRPGARPRTNPNQPAKLANFVAPPDPRNCLAFFTGDIGNQVLASLRSRMEKGQYGAFLQESAKLAPVARPGDPNQPPPGAVPGLPANLPAIPGVDPQAVAAAMGALGLGANAAEPGIGNVMPGVVMLGEGKIKDVLDQARKQRVDLAIVFSVQVRVIRDFGQNTTRMALYDVAKGEILGSSGYIVNTHILKEREAGKESNEVEEEVEKLLTLADNKFAMTELPAAATADRVAAHVARQSASQPADPLAFLAEVQFYHGLQLITDEQRDQACEAVVGKETLEKVKDAKPEELQSLLAAFLPGQKPAKEPGNEPKP